MNNPDKLFEEITSELTAEGQLFETREYKDMFGQLSKEYATFPENLKGYFDFGLLHAE